jgi:uncharacterized membrane protein
MMDLQYLANLGELVGAVVVVLSLIYLAVQVRQNTQAQRTENYSRALDRLAAIQTYRLEGGLRYLETYSSRKDAIHLVYV